ncbi:siderophore-interacting protein [Nocardiopsis sp. CNT312]|uniref:siderophore-interacting protein n=1 Tax=Nocardiopsis sp. CNT312 TaxID=1137268 RepID=UPI0004920871|nr:siderophore-interacting protein [Nocardiopsis sp. CNT312]
MPRTSRPLQVYPIVLRRTSVARIVDVTPNMRRITLTGDELFGGTMGGGHERPPFRSNGFDDHIKIVVPAEDGTVPHIGTQEEQRFAWNPEGFARTRDYTVRAWDPDTGTLDIDIVRHDHGLASSWALRAQEGDTLHFAGPKTCALRNDEAEWHLLAGDETALPAIGRWLEEAPEGTRGHVIVEVPTAEDRQEIGTAADVDIEWLVRDGAPAGTSTLLFEAVRRLAVPEGRVYAWVGGEAMTVAPIRRHLRKDLGLPKEDVEVVGYWRRPEAADADGAGTHDEPGTPTAPEGPTPRELLHEVHEMSELGPPVVTRAAVTLGICPLIASGTTTVVGLGRESGVEPERLAPLLDAMTALGLVERDGDHYRNTARGGVLMDDAPLEALSLDNPANREALALVDLVDVLRSGRHAARLGTASWRERRAADEALDTVHQDRAAEQLQFVAEPLAQLPVVAGARTLAVVGDAAPYLAAQIARGRTVQLPGADASVWPEHDCAILVGALEGRTDDEVLALLRTALAAGPALVVAEPTSDKAAADDHAAERALVSLAVTGTALRTSDRIGGLLRAAGASTVETAMLGWGFGPYGNAVIARA